MWPKVFAQLVEILPHVARLIPMADVFFASKTAGEKNNEAAIAAMSEQVRTELGKVTAAHESLYRQLQDQGAQIAATASDLNRARVAIENHADRVAHLEKKIDRLNIWSQSAVVLLVIAIGCLIAILIRH
jgi:septal ring factor EnvC (AmiA/AmiB activator)